MTTLLPCPFCGSVAGPEPSRYDDTIPRGWVTCGDCKADGPPGYQVGKMDAEKEEIGIKLWNTRKS